MQNSGFNTFNELLKMNMILFSGLLFIYLHAWSGQELLQSPWQQKGTQLSFALDCDTDLYDKVYTFVTQCCKKLLLTLTIVL